MNLEKNEAKLVTNLAITSAVIAGTRYIMYRVEKRRRQKRAERAITNLLATTKAIQRLTKMADDPNVTLAELEQAAREERQFLEIVKEETK